MAYEYALVNRTFEAGANLSGNQYHFGKQNTSDQIVVCDTQGEAANGVIQNDPDASGKATTVTVGGISKVEAGQAISIGDAITTGADGRAETAATGDIVAGYARTAASAAGVLVSVELTVPHHYTAA